MTDTLTSTQTISSRCQARHHKECGDCACTCHLTELVEQVEQVERNDRSLAVVANDSILTSGIFTETGLNLPPGMTYDQWGAVGRMLRRMNLGLGWAVGDWIHYGEAAPFREKASQLIDELGLKYQSIANSARVAKAIPAERRRETLSFAHHEAVAGLDEEKASLILDQVERDQLNVRQTRELVRGPKPIPQPGSAPPMQDPLLRFCPSNWSTAKIVAGILRVCFPDAVTALDATYGNGAFWDGSAHVQVTGMDSEPGRAPDGVADFRDLPAEDSSYDVVLIDPPHLADGGEDSIMAQRFGTYSDMELAEATRDGTMEAWRVAKLGVIVKVTDAVHGQEYVLMTDCVRYAVGSHLGLNDAQPYDVVYQTRDHSMVDPKWGEQLSAYNNGSTYLIFRKDGPRHVKRG